MIDFYASPTANCQRVTLALEELGLAYRLHRVDRARGDQRLPAFLALNPAGMVPVIVDPDGPAGSPITLAQSGAILMYLADKTGRLMPDDRAGRALARQWLMQVLTDVNAAASALFLTSNVTPEKVESTIGFFRDRLARFLGDCDRQLAGREYLAGALSIADLALYPVVDFRRAIIEQPGAFVNLKRWQAALAARPAIARAMAATA